MKVTVIPVLYWEGQVKYLLVFTKAAIFSVSYKYDFPQILLSISNNFETFIGATDSLSLIILLLERVLEKV